MVLSSLRKMASRAVLRDKSKEGTDSVESTESPRLPPELVREILLEIDPTVLTDMSLVCRDWSDYARPLIFYRLWISLENVGRFVRLFKSPRRVTFDSHVREIVLDPHVALGQDWCAPELLPKIVAKFPHFTTLTTFGFVPNPEVLELDGAFRAVTRLEVKVKAKLSPESFTSFVATFPRLEQLKVTLPHRPGPVPTFPPGREPPTHLNELDLDNPFILHWIDASNPRPSIASLCFRMSRSQTVPIAVEAIGSLSSSLHSFDLTLPNTATGTAFLSIDRLNLRSRLRTLHLRADHTQAAEILLKILSEPHLDTSRLKEISLDFQVSDADQLVPILPPWDALNTALSALPALCRLTMSRLIWNEPLGSIERVILREASRRLQFPRSPDVKVATTAPPLRLNRRGAGAGDHLPAHYIYY
ncbi:hypothetical protein C8R43DRAFT_991435 [Mycena crocata]|nr:hypothetical protein C8R43DRAFT_991435 [Mycena crocata]